MSAVRVAAFSELDAASAAPDLGPIAHDDLLGITALLPFTLPKRFLLF
jgi:hypothetical protein